MNTSRTSRSTALFVLGLLLLAFAAAGTYHAASSLLDDLAPGVNPAEASFEAVRVMAIVTCLAALVVVLVALAIVRRERHRRKHSDERLERLLRTADQVGEFIAVVNRKGRIEYVNRAVEQATGWTRAELVGKRSRPWLPWYGDEQAFDDMRAIVLGGTAFRGTVGGRRKDGSSFLLQEYATPLQEGSGQVTRFVSTARDITSQKQLEDRLEYLGTYDPLTGIPNRRYFADLLTFELGERQTDGSRVAVMIMDIDRFKYINDLFGVAIGDEVLQRITEVLRSTVGEHDVVARLGSDEFGVVHRYSEQLIDTGAVAERIRQAVSQRITVGGQDIVATVTIGVATCPEHGSDVRTLLQHADMALSRAKSQGRNTIQFYNKDMSERISDFYIMERRLFSALRNGEYRVDYQPFCELSSRRITGAEALIRWTNGELGAVGPGRFIPALEESGLIVEVGEWVLQTACRQIRDWKRCGRPVSVSVNLSHAQFRSRNLVSLVSSLVRETGIDPRLLALELTESICIQDIDFAVGVLRKLKDVGVSLSVDDFGTGYSSLSYIKKLPLDTLKIDMSFVRDVTRDPDAASIVTAITGMARSLDLKTIAEGVESEEQRNILHLLRCDMGQGYLFSPAVPAADFERIATDLTVRSALLPR